MTYGSPVCFFDGKRQKAEGRRQTGKAEEERKKGILSSSKHLAGSIECPPYVLC
jgi:hypothetical protein